MRQPGYIHQLYFWFQKKYPKMSNSTFWHRVFSIFLLYPFVIFFIFMGGFFFNFFILIFSFFLAYEWISVSDHLADEVSYLRYYAITFLCILFASINYWLIACIIAFGGIFLLAYGNYRKQRKLWYGMFGLSYIIGACLALVWIRKQGLFPAVFLFSIVIGADTLAYSIGSWLKGPKICLNISPNKTWSGAVAAVLIAPLIALILALFFGVKASFLFIFSALILAISSVLGDLIESYFKRKFGVKDTSNIIPGHGGVWDRSDALLLSSLVLVGLSFLGWFPNSGSI